jgi:mevalonate pyrophosphate decarboxylase
MATAVAHSNFALIKYWGKADHSLNIPAAGSISVTVDKLTTETTVEFKGSLDRDVLWLNGKQISEGELLGLTPFLDIFRKMSEDSRFADATFWPLSILIAITSLEPKEIGSTNGMNLTSETSPYCAAWIESTRQDLPDMRAAIEARNFTRVGALMELSCLKMHGTMLSASPGLICWNAGTLEVIEVVKSLRKQGKEAYFTIETGPQVKILCQEKTKPVILDAFLEIVWNAVGD